MTRRPAQAGQKPVQDPPEPAAAVEHFRGREPDGMDVRLGYSPTSVTLPVWVLACIRLMPAPEVGPTSMDKVLTAAYTLQADALNPKTGDLAVELDRAELAAICGYERADKVQWILDYLARIEFIRIFDGGVDKLGRRKPRRDPLTGQPLPNTYLVFADPPPHYRGPRSYAEFHAHVSLARARSEAAAEKAKTAREAKRLRETVILEPQDLFDKTAGGDWTPKPGSSGAGDWTPKPGSSETAGQDWTLVSGSTMHGSSYEDQKNMHDAFWSKITSTVTQVDPPGRTSVRAEVVRAFAHGWTPENLAGWVEARVKAAGGRITNCAGFVVAQLRAIPSPAETRPAPKQTPPGPEAWPAWCQETGAGGADPCDETSRQRYNDATGGWYRCPACHPAEVGRTRSATPVPATTPPEPQVKRPAPAPAKRGRTGGGTSRAGGALGELGLDLPR
jgi:hypothetical protein